MPLGGRQWASFEKLGRETNEVPFCVQSVCLTMSGHEYKEDKKRCYLEPLCGSLRVASLGFLQRENLARRAKISGPWARMYAFRTADEAGGRSS